MDKCPNCGSRWYNYYKGAGNLCMQCDIEIIQEIGQASYKNQLKKAEVQNDEQGKN